MPSTWAGIAVGETRNVTEQCPSSDLIGTVRLFSSPGRILSLPTLRFPDSASTVCGVVNRSF